MLLVVVLGPLPSQAAEDHTAPAASATPGEYVPGANALEGRILAPCCWNQTLDIHGSEVSNQLRREIRTRLKAGESADTIEADIVSRYGEKIRAVPPSSPLASFATWLMVALGAAGVGAVFMVRRWRAAASEEKRVEPPAGADADEWDARLDDELERAE